MEVEMLVAGKKRRIEFKCPECGRSGARWVNKQPQTDVDKLLKKVSFDCIFCGATLTINPLEEKK